MWCYWVSDSEHSWEYPGVSHESADLSWPLPVALMAKLQLYRLGCQWTEHLFWTEPLFPFPWLPPRLYPQCWWNWKSGCCCWYSWNGAMCWGPAVYVITFSSTPSSVNPPSVRMFSQSVLSIIYLKQRLHCNLVSTWYVCTHLFSPMYNNSKDVYVYKEGRGTSSHSLWAPETWIPPGQDIFLHTHLWNTLLKIRYLEKIWGRWT